MCVTASASHEEFEREFRADPFLARLLIDFSRRRRKLDSHAGIVFKEGYLLLAFSPSALSGQELCQLVEIVRLDHAALESLGKLRLAGKENLRFVAHDDQTCSLNGF